MKMAKRYISRVALMAVAGLLVLSGISPAFAQEKWVLGTYVKDGAIDTGSPGSKLAVRSGPGTSYERVDAIAHGTKVTEYEKKNGWVRISLPPVESTALKEFFSTEDPKNKTPALTPAQTAPAQVAPAQVAPAQDAMWVDGKYVKNGAVDTGIPSASLAVRSGPGKDYSTVKSLPNGEKVTVYETKDGWVRISPDPKTQKPSVATTGAPAVAANLVNLSALLLLFLRRK